MDSNEQDTPSSDRSRSTPPADGYSVAGFHENLSGDVAEAPVARALRAGASRSYQFLGPSTTTSPPTEGNGEAPTLFAADSLAKTSPWQGVVLDWLESDPDFSSSSCASLMKSLPVGFSSRTSLAFFHRTKDGTWEPSSGRWQTSGMGGPTGCLTLATSEWPNAAVECSLSDVLETQPVPQKYYLSAKAAQGILKRAAKRERALPAQLQEALSDLAAQTTTTPGSSI